MRQCFVHVVLGRETFPSHFAESDIVDFNVTDNGLNFQFLIAAFRYRFCASINAVLNQSI
jgi:hypothetical protein